MNGLLTAVGSVCITVIIIGFFEIFFPSERFEKPMKLLAGAVIAAAVISVVCSVSMDFDISSIDIGYTDTNIEQQTAQSASKIISVILENNGISDATIKIDTSTNEKGGIELSKVTVQTDTPSDKQKIKKEINAVLGVTAYFSEENNE